MLHGIPKTVTLILAFTLTFTLSSPKTFSAALFSDIDSLHPDYQAIKYLADRNIIEGYEDQSFKAASDVSRAESLKIILLAAGYNISNAENQTSVEFSDLNSSQWFYPFVAKAFEQEIIGGYPDGKFHPEKPVILAEALKMILKTFEAKLPQEIKQNPFNDVPADVWHAPYFEFYKQYHLLKGDSAGNIQPDQIVSRGMLATLVYKYIKRQEFKEMWQQKSETFIYGKATFYGRGDGFHGRGTANGEIFDENKFTAASRTLPFDTKIRVWSIENPEKFVDVRINDRGPWSKDRNSNYRFILDLSGAAFEALAPISRGYIEVKYQILP